MALGIKPAEIIEKSGYPLLSIAPHWSRVELGEVADVQNGYAFSSAFFTKKVGLPLIRIRDISATDTQDYYDGLHDEQYLIEPGEILVGMDGDFRVAVWRGPKGLLNQRVCRIVFNSRHYSKSFLTLCLQPYLDAIHAETSSVTVKHLSSRTIDEIPLPLPPLAEQKRIVAKIEELFSELDKGVETLKQVREQLKVYRQSVLKHAFEGKLTTEWRKKNKPESAEKLLERIRAERVKQYEEQLEEWKEAVKRWEAEGKKDKKPGKPREPVAQKALGNDKANPLSPLPIAWAWTRLGALIEVPRYGTAKRCTYEPAGKGVLRIPNIARGFIDAADLKYAVFTEAEMESYRLKGGDLLMIRSNGSLSLVGRCALIRHSDEKFLFAGYLVRVRLFTESVSSRYVKLALGSPTVRQQIESAAKSTSGVNNINSQEIMNLYLPLLPPQEQTEIVETIESRLSLCENLEQAIEENLQKSDILRQSILKRAFEGKLVPQDPADEPASVLLEKIRLERAEREAAEAREKTAAKTARAKSREKQVSKKK